VKHDLSSYMDRCRTSCKKASHMFRKQINRVHCATPIYSLLIQRVFA